MLRFGINLPLVLAAQIAFGCGGTKCPRSCPAADVVLSVTAVPDGGPVDGVEVGFTGEATGVMRCEPGDTESVCWWPVVPAAAGNYSLQISAPGYASAEVQSTITVTPYCGCSFANLNPSRVTLSRGLDGGL